MLPATSPYDRLRARVLLSGLLGVLFVTIATSASMARPGPGREVRDLILTGVGMLLSYAGVAVVTGVVARRAGVRVMELYGEPPAPGRLASLASLGVPLFGLALVGAYVLYAPLSVVAPGFVTAWVLDDMVVYLPGPPYPWLANGLAVIVGVVAAPLVEEWFFRGLLLRRWTRKWGVVPAVMVSSLAFALMHTDVLGGFLFSVVMCGLCARFRSLWAPTVAHAANNAISFGLAALDAHGLPLPPVDTVEQLRAAIWMPVVGLLMLLPWLIALRGNVPPMSTWRFERDETGESALAPALSPGAGRSAAP